MKTHTFTTKTTLFCKLLLLLLAALLFVSCNQAVKMPSDKTLRQIELDYGRLITREEYDPAVHGKISVLKCYGVYNGCVPVFLSGPWDTTDISKPVTVADVVFHYSTATQITVWKDGSFYSLQEAYDEELLTKDNLQTIADIHNRVWKELS